MPRKFMNPVLMTLIFSFSSVSFAGSSSKKNEIPVISNLKFKVDYKSEMNCTIFDSNGRVIYVEDQDGTVMKLDNEKVKLSLNKKSDSSSLSYVSKKGEKEKILYDVGDLNIEILAEVSSVCPPGLDSCDGISYSVQMTLKKGKNSRVFKGFTGDCP